jgi:hypothetical protein
VARSLSKAWGVPVFIGFPPDGWKDARAYLSRFGQYGLDFYEEDAPLHGRRLCEAILASKEEFVDCEGNVKDSAKRDTRTNGRSCASISLNTNNNNGSARAERSDPPLQLLLDLFD